jgi:D-aminopeptidase
MTRLTSKRLEAVIDGLARAYPGPGGAVAVMHEGETIARHAWGYANAERWIPFTPKTLFRVCSITKQFTCAVMLDAFPDPSVLDADVRRQLPALTGAVPTAAQLAHNQSGLRDYWAVAMLQGAPVESAFGENDGDALIRATSSLQFAPGTRYSYANNNFRILSNVLEQRTGRGFAEWLRARIFAPVGMESAFLAADTRAMPDSTEGYEGTVAGGFRAAENRIIWTGDAGMGASLDDMIAWERHIDASRDTPDSLYGRIAAPVHFADGSPASYGFGLARGQKAGLAYLGHDGALRGWRSSRAYFPEKRLSVVVLMNSLSTPHLALPEPLAPPPWLGTYIEPETGLSLRAEAGAAGQAAVRFGLMPSSLTLDAEGASDTAGNRLRPVVGGLRLERPGDNFASLLRPLPPGEAAKDVNGKFHCAEIGSSLTVENAGGALYGAFSGALGRGRMELLESIGRDVWTLPCHRALDHTPPGDWTLAFRRDEGGRVRAAEVGCWLARGLVYQKD